MSEFTSEDKGCVFLDRRLIETEWFTGCSPSAVFLMMYLLFVANYKPTVWRGIKVNRGEVICSIGNPKHPGRLMEETRLPYSTLVRSLDTLKSLGVIKVKSESGFHGYTLISIVNYDLYTRADTKANTKVAKKGNKKTADSKEETQNEDLTMEQINEMFPD